MRAIKFTPVKASTVNIDLDDEIQEVGKDQKKKFTEL
jgi:hypothetical protein